MFSTPKMQYFGLSIGHRQAETNKVSTCTMIRTLYERLKQIQSILLRQLCQTVRFKLNQFWFLICQNFYILKLILKNNISHSTS